MNDRLYTKDHEWIKEENGIYTLGITQHASSELGDIVFVELPEIEDEFDLGESIGTIEAVKTVAEIYTPANCTIVEINDALEDDASIINNDPYNDGWIVKFALNGELEDCMSYDEYQELVG